MASSTLDAENGWHWKEWLAEAAGTAMLLFAVVTAKDLAVRSGPPLADLPWRSIVTALVAGLTVGLVAVSPIGRRSGAHLNPALTFGLWLQRTVSNADLGGYWAAQIAGSVLGVAAARVWGPTVSRVPVDWALLGPSIPQPLAAGLECAATLIQLSLVFVLLSSRRYHQWAPVATGVILAVAFVLAPLSGGALNPVRGLAPDELADAYPAVWIYIIGPLIGAGLAAAALTTATRQPATGKLRHDPSIRCHMRCTLGDSADPSH